MGFIKKHFVWVLFGGVFVLWALVPFATGVFASDANARGVLGDQFGSVTALFSGLAFAGLILTLMYQSKALGLQRDELKLTRESVEKQTEELGISSLALQEQIKEMSAQKNEMEEMKKAQQAQADYMLLQGFENTFFQMLKLWNEHIESFEGRSKVATLMESACVDIGDYKYSIMAMGETRSPEDYYKSEEEQKTLFLRDFNGDGELFLRPYILLLLHCLKHISDAKIGEINKKKYAQIIRANLSSAEKKFLLFNCAFQHRKVLKPLLEKFSILSGLDQEIKEKNQHLCGKYEAKVFN